MNFFDQLSNAPRSRPGMPVGKAPGEPMSYADAIDIRHRHSLKQPVDVEQLEEANRIVAETRKRVLSTDADLAEEERAGAPQAQAETEPEERPTPQRKGILSLLDTSLPARVIMHLRGDTSIQMSASEIATTFNVSRQGVYTQLKRAEQHEALERVSDSVGAMHWRLGPLQSRAHFYSTTAAAEIDRDAGYQRMTEREPVAGAPASRFPLQLRISSIIEDGKGGYDLHAVGKITVDQLAALSDILHAEIKA